MNTLTAVRRRRRSEDGFITIQVLGLVLLVLGTMLLIVGSAASSRNAAREGKEFTDTGRGTDQATARLVYHFNTAAANAPFGLNGTTARTGSMAVIPPGFPGATWSTDPTARTVTVTSTSDDTTRTVTTPVRGKLVSSYRDTADGIAAGIPAGSPISTGSQDALGAWGSAVSSSGDTFNGDGSITYKSMVMSGVYGNEAKTVPGQWDVYGGTVNYAGGANVVSYSNEVVVPTQPGVGGTFDRSRVNAYLDEKQHDKLMSNVVSSSLSCSGGANQGTLLTTANLNSSPSTYFCAKGNVTIGDVNRTTAGVTTIVVKGSLTLSGSINTGTAGELHIYADNQVYFSLVGTQNFNRVYFFGPNNHCVNGASSIVTITGSIACKRVQMAATGSTVAWVRPRNQPAGLPYTYGSGDSRNVPAPTPVYYFEKPGFRDRLTP